MMNRPISHWRRHVGKADIGLRPLRHSASSFWWRPATGRGKRHPGPRRVAALAGDYTVIAAVGCPVWRWSRQAVRTQCEPPGVLRRRPTCSWLDNTLPLRNEPIRIGVIATLPLVSLRRQRAHRAIQASAAPVAPDTSAQPVFPA